MVHGNRGKHIGGRATEPMLPIGIKACHHGMVNAIAEKTGYTLTSILDAIITPVFEKLDIPAFIDELANYDAHMTIKNEREARKNQYENLQKEFDRLFEVGQIWLSSDLKKYRKIIHVKEGSRNKQSVMEYQTENKENNSTTRKTLRDWLHTNDAMLLQCYPEVHERFKEIHGVDV